MALEIFTAIFNFFENLPPKIWASLLTTDLWGFTLAMSDLQFVLHKNCKIQIFEKPVNNYSVTKISLVQRWNL